MSSWQQALAEDIRKGKPRKDACPVVMNRNQEKNLKTGREDPDKDAWKCSCGTMNMGTYYRCERCGALRPDERATRQEMRARDCEIGRGGGFFQRPSPDDRKGWDSDGEEYDEFGRKKRKATAGAQAAAGSKVSAANVITGSAPSTRSDKKDPAAKMSDRQKAALARLHQKNRGTVGRSSRSRSPAGR
mmetsp:Transcript_100500/g.260042  ORF Transcript_100500/g.260042 Transcript_100500/m.260042 type:complete len:188 (-) Transcript_100500:15-578(-)